MLHDDFVERIEKMKRKKLTQEEIDALLTGQLRYLENRHCNDLDFSSKVLHNVMFVNCSFKKTRFDHSTMCDVVFEECNLTNADLTFTVLVRVRFERCTALYSVFNFSYFHNVSFYSSKFQNNRFHFVQLHYFCFDNTNFDGTSFQNAWFGRANKITHTDFSKTKDINLLPKCPEVGSFIGWKKCQAIYSTTCSSICIAKLLIPEDAKRISGFTNKCRASKAKVLEFQDMNGRTLNITKAYSLYCEEVAYVKDDIVYANDFDPSPYKECTHGIHFFMHRQEAVNY